MIRTREAVESLRARGLSATRIAAQLGVSKSTVCYHLRRLGVPPDMRCNRRYDWETVQRYYDDGHSVSQCLGHFGMTRAAFVAAVRRGAFALAHTASRSRICSGRGSIATTCGCD
jgi:hypothetical protein